MHEQKPYGFSVCGVTPTPSYTDMFLQSGMIESASTGNYKSGFVVH